MAVVPHHHARSPRGSTRSRALWPACVVVIASACFPMEGVPAGATPAIGGAEPELVRREQVVMGTWFTIQVVAGDVALASRAIDAAFAEIARVERAISEWRADSDISGLNRAAGQGAYSAGDDLLSVIERALDIARLTDGAFDVTFATCADLWSAAERRVPASSAVEACVGQIGTDRVAVDRAARTITLRGDATRVGVGGIGKGYGVDRAVEVLHGFGLVDFTVDGGGDVRVAGRRGSRPWTAGVANPHEAGRVLLTIQIMDEAVATSGDYERYFEHDGVRYHHVLDPRTGWPARGVASATVIASDAMTADALATGIFVSGVDRGIALAESLAGVEALVVSSEGALSMTDGFARRVIDASAR